MSTTTVDAIVEERCAKMNWLKASLNRLLYKALPRRIRRLVFIASVVGYLHDSVNVPDALIDKLNRLLNLAHDPNAIRFPIVIHNVIWRSLKEVSLAEHGIVASSLKEYIKNLKTEEEISQLADLLIENAPCWTLYEKPEVIEKELKVLLHAIS